jgi:hypothetical protein
MHTIAHRRSVVYLAHNSSNNICTIQRATNKLTIEIMAELLIVKQGKAIRHVEYSSINNLPISYGSVQNTSRVELSVAEVNTCLTAASTQNISNTQRSS